jgi:cytochrome P450
MDASSIPLDDLDVITAKSYGEHGYPHEAWARLRRESPIHRFEPAGYEPFWAVTKHADIVEVSKQPDKFKSAGRFILFPELQEGMDAAMLADDPPLRMLVNMDPPEHRDYRALVSPRPVSRRSHGRSSTTWLGTAANANAISSPTSPPSSRFG